MAWANDTINLTKEIASLHDVRKKAIGQMRDEVRGNLTKVHADLANAEKQRVGDAQTDLKQKRSELKEMGDQVRATLTKAEKERAGQTQSDLKHRKAEHTGLAEAEKERVRQAQTTLKQRQSELKEMSDQIRATLAKAEKERAGQTQSDLKHRKAELKEMGDQVRADLARAEKGRVSQAQTALKQRQSELKEMGDQVRATLTRVDEFLHEFRSQREKAAAAWQEIAGIFQVKGQTSVTVAEPAAKPEPVESAPKKGVLRDRAFSYLADHPDGAMMTELEREFEVARIQMANIIRSLIDDNKVEKREMLYFAI